MEEFMEDLFEDDNLYLKVSRVNQGLYVLINNDKKVYIGKSFSLMKRIYSHINSKEKQFNKMILIPLRNKSDINILEVYLISKIKPLYNTDCKEDDTTTIHIDLPHDNVLKISVNQFIDAFPTSEVFEKENTAAFDKGHMPREDLTDTRPW